MPLNSVSAPAQPVQPPPDSGITDLDLASVTRICGTSQQVMVYGWGHCGYGEVATILRQHRYHVFDSRLGNPDQSEENALTTLEGDRIHQIRVEEDNVAGLPKYCKAALTNLVIENFKRRQQGKKLIPALFCLDTDNNNYPTTPQSVAARNKDFITNQELRRIYKLCYQYGNEEFRQVARETFRFVKVVKAKNGKHALVQTIAPWNRPGWHKAWKDRGKANKPLKQISWKAEVSEALQGIRIAEVSKIALPNPTKWLSSVAERVSSTIFSAFGTVSPHLSA